MKILELNILEFGGLADRVITLSDGLNVLEGENEAGKSTIWLFVKFMLYGLPRKGQEERSRSISRQGHCAKGSMRLLHEGEEYTIERIFVEGSRSGSERLTVYRVSDGTAVFGGMEPGEAFLGVPREIFESSCGIGQMRVEALSGKKGADAIRNLLSSADESTDVGKIEEKLDKIRVQYRHKTGKGGKLYELSERLSTEKTALMRAQETHGRIASLEEKLDRNRAQEEETSARLTKLEGVLRGAAKRDLLRRFDTLRESETEYRATLERIEEFRRATLRDEILPTESDAAQLRALADRLAMAEKRVEVAYAEQECLMEEGAVDGEMADVGRTIQESGGLDAKCAAWRNNRKSAKSARIGGFSLLGISVAFFGIFFAISFVIWSLIVASFALIFGITLIALGTIKAKNNRETAKIYGKEEADLLAYWSACDVAWREKQRLSDRMARVTAELGSVKQIREEISSELHTLLARSPFADRTQADSITETARFEADRIAEFLKTDGELTRKAQVLARGIERDRVLLEAYDESSLREEITPELLSMNEDQVRRAETEQRFYTAQRESLQATIRRDQVELISLRANSEAPTRIADRIAALEEAYARADEYFEALNLALEGIRHASETMSGSVTPALSRDAGAMVSYLSDGRYTSLHTGNDLTPMLVGEDGLRVDTELLSGGTRDAAYLALRLALIKQIFRGELPPLMMDEALCQMDDCRMKRMLSLLERLCREQGIQCLLFTCQSRECAACEELGIPHTRVFW